MKSDPRLQRIAREMDEIAQDHPEWSIEARTALRALSNKVEDFHPGGTDLLRSLVAMRGRLSADAFEIIDSELIEALAQQMTEGTLAELSQTTPPQLTEGLLAYLFAHAMTVFWAAIEHSAATRNPREDLPTEQ